jgi:type I restriction enzyme S subunit
MMNKIQQLIAEHCPNGVEFKKLGEVCEFQRGTTITAKDAVEGDVPVIAGGQTPAYYHNVANRTGETISVSSSGAYAGFVAFWTIPVFLSDSFSVNPNPDLLLPKYVFYFLKNIQEQIHHSKKGSGVPHVHGSDLAKFPIPLPPLPVQHEIVAILDKFTELEVELEVVLKAELEARKKQYEYYRCNLLTFNDMRGGGVKWMTIKEIGGFYGGLSGKSKTDFENGNAKFITYMNVFSNIAVKTDIQDFVKISENEKQNKVKVGDIIFTGSSETPEECGMSCVLTEQIDENLYLNSFCFGLRLNDEYKELLSPEFSKYLFRSKEIRKQIVQTASGVTRFNVSKKRMEKVKIPIPPLEEQSRIVAILDKFEALVNDMSTGLPAEIRMRRQQYEHYRNKLLTFDRYE